MPCPFPGMDPYLEMPPNWGDFVPDFLAEIRNELLRQLFPRFNVRVEEYVLVMRDEEPLHRLRPDVTIAEPPSWNRRGGLALQEATSTAVVEAELTELAYPDLDPEIQRRIAIIRPSDNQVITVMEVLSPSNKAPGERGFEAYLAKRNELVASAVNLVELDLLRGGNRPPMRGDLPPGDYFALIGRAERRPPCDVIGWSLRAKLPVIPIPLTSDERDAQLDLSESFRKAYDPAIFDQRLPYDEPLYPAPDKKTREWIDECLSKRIV